MEAGEHSSRVHAVHKIPSMPVTCSLLLQAPPVPLPRQAAILTRGSFLLVPSEAQSRPGGRRGFRPPRMPHTTNPSREKARESHADCTRSPAAGLSNTQDSSASKRPYGNRNRWGEGEGSPAEGSDSPLPSEVGWRGREGGGGGAGWGLEGWGPGGAPNRKLDAVLEALLHLYRSLEGPGTCHAA